MNKTLKYSSSQIDAAIEKIIGLDTSIITNLINNKYDNATLSGNILKLYANGVEKKSLTLPTSSGGGSGTPGTDGREVELSVQSNYIVWRYKGDSNWINLVSLESLKGPTGATGATGASGSNGTNATINGMETIEIVGGTNISIEKNTTNKTITINSTVVGGGSGNVDLSNYYTKGQVDTKDTEIKNTIGTLGSLATTEKTNVVGAVNEVTTQLENLANKFTTEQTSNSFIIKYNGTVIANILLNAKVIDIIKPIKLTINEKATGIFTIELAERIRENETIRILSSNNDLLTVYPQSIVFTSENWNRAYPINIYTKGIVAKSNVTCNITLVNNNIENTINVTVNKVTTIDKIVENQVVNINTYFSKVGKSKYFNHFTFGEIISGSANTKRAYEVNGDCTALKIIDIPRDAWIFRKENINGKVRYLYSNCYNNGVGTGSQFSELVVLDENKQEIDRVRMIGGGISGDIDTVNFPCDPHEFLMIADGHYVVMSYKKITPNNIPSGVSLPKEVTMAWIQEIKDKKIIFDWKSTDHVHLYHDTTASNIDYIHINSIRIDDDNNFICSFRECSMCVKINRVTGEVMWKLGGKNDQFGLTAQQKPKFQHDFRKTKDGTYTIFDNRTGESVSRICEYKIDEKNKKLLDFKEYKWKNYQGSYCGSAEKIEEGVFLVGWGLTGNHAYDIGEYNFNTSTANFEMKYTGNGDVYKVFGDNVTNPFVYSQPIPCTNITLNKSTLTFTSTDSQSLIATVTPTTTTDDVIWSSDNSLIATVSSGLVIPKSNGTCNIKATCGSQMATCSVNVSGLTTAPTENLYASFGSGSFLTDLSGNNHNFTNKGGFTNEELTANELVFTGDSTYSKVLYMNTLPDKFGLEVEFEFGASINRDTYLLSLAPTHTADYWNDGLTVCFHSNQFKFISGKVPSTVIDIQKGTKHKIKLIVDNTARTIGYYLNNEFVKTVNCSGAINCKSIVLGVPNFNKGSKDESFIGKVYSLKILNV